MLKLLRVIFEKTAADGNERQQIDRNGMLVGLFFAVVSALLTFLNVLKGYHFMAWTTTFLIFGFLTAAFFSYKKKGSISRYISAALVAGIFSIYALQGSNEGFAILWILLVPIISFMMLGIRLGFFLSLYFQIFLFCLFYSPLSAVVQGYYTETFQMRFPFLYFATFGGVTLLMCQREQLYRQVQHDAFYDALTGLHNRHYYHEIQKRMDDADAYPELCMVSIDLNRLKFTNDTFGHDAGDELLSNAAKLIEQAFPGDTCCRTGGDEFEVICSGGDVDSKIKDLREISDKWRSSSIGELRIWLSIGSAARSEHSGTSVAQLAKLADQAMYEDKLNFYKRSGMERRK